MHESKSVLDILTEAGNNLQDIKNLQEELMGYKATVKRTMDMGLSPDEFKRLEGLYNALQAAEEIIQKLT